MKAICRAIREFFYGPTDVTPPAPSPDNPPVETFCRTNRFAEWLESMEKDVKAIHAQLVQVKCYDDPVLYRCVIGNGFDEDRIGHSIWFNCDTMKPISVGELFRKGIESGEYGSWEKQRIDDRAPYEKLRHDREKPDPREHVCIPRFTNNVQYELRSGYENYLHHFYRDHPRAAESECWSALGVQWFKRWDLAKDWNQYPAVVGGDWEDGILVLEKIDDVTTLFSDLEVTGASIGFRVLDRETGKVQSTFRVPKYVARVWFRKNVKTLEFWNTTTKAIQPLFDPIRVRALANDEEHGTEAYVALVPGKHKDTFTRTRFRVEVDSELLHAGTICKLTTLYKNVAKRLLLEGAAYDGKLYVDNFHYMRNDGTEHSPDPAGFSTIGAEPYYDRRERVHRSKFKHAREGHLQEVESSGPFLITNQDFPEEPIY
uniref:Terminase large subunit n=1 Tax=Pseudomonas phage RVTF4 TaxID=3236931 RepID=A0AB39CD38_9VIRU